MTINLPKTNQTGKNEWADVEDNDVKLKEEIEATKTEVAAISGITWYTPKVIATEQERENTSYGFLTTEDKIASVVVPENGLLKVSYSALWKESFTGAGRAAIFIGSDQLKIPKPGAVPVAQEAKTNGSGGTFNALVTSSVGLVTGSPGEGTSSFVTTGMVLGLLEAEADFTPNETLAKYPGGETTIFRLPAGTYTVGVKYKATSGKVTVKERALQVWTLG